MSKTRKDRRTVEEREETSTRMVKASRKSARSTVKSKLHTLIFDPDEWDYEDELETFEKF
jgi:hypothetical protein